ncbi:hypothetical protein AB0878_36870 [Amycolatopsis sp. NPDC047767]|uniref:hypothetical protein n=1 Tax=Amycolatopsis sp. NPDC047767 TaxID=3156765 RepID=UPI003453C00A
MSSEDDQSPEEMAAALSDGSAGEFVAAWADVVLNHRDWTLAMQVATPELRLATVQLFLHSLGDIGLSNAERDAVAADLASINTSNPIWDDYAAALLGSFDERRQGGRLGVGTLQRPVDIDHERIVLIDYDNSPHEIRVVNGQEIKVRPAEHELRGWPLLARRTPTGWLLASYGEELPEQGGHRSSGDTQEQRRRPAPHLKASRDQ